MALSYWPHEANDADRELEQRIVDILNNADHHLTVREIEQRIKRCPKRPTPENFNYVFVASARINICDCCTPDDPTCSFCYVVNPKGAPL